MKKVYNLLRHFALCVGILGMAMLPSQLDAQCSISTVTATATLCSGANSNSYNVSGQVSFANAPGTGSLVISVQGGHSAVINAPFTSPVSYNIQKLIADGVNRTVTAYFTATPSCTGNTSVTVPSPVGTGFTTLPLNSYASTFYWGTMPYPQESWDGGYVPEYGGPFSFGGGIHDLDLQPQGITNMAAFCAELAEGVAGTTTYTGTYQYIPLENVSRGRATEALTESVHIPAGGIGRVRAGMLRWLFDQYYTSTNAATWTNSNAAAFQLAVWEIIHEVYSTNNSFTITSATPNGFYILATYNLTSRNLAESHLQALNALNWTDAQWMSYQSVNWHVIAIEHNQDPAPGGGDSQDLVLAQPLVCVVSCTTPTAFAAATQPTCSGGVAQSNGTITISGFTAGQRYQYSSGATFNSGAATPASITPIPMSGVITSTLPNTTQQYTVRIYDATDDACFVDRVVSLTAVCCNSCFFSTNWFDGIVLKFDGISGTPSGTFGPPHINLAYDAAIGPDGMLYVASSAGNKVIKFNPSTGVHLGDFVSAGSGGLATPTGLVFGPDGDLYVSGTTAIYKYDGSTGAFISKFVDNNPAGFQPFQGIEFGPDGHLYSVDNNGGYIRKYNGATGALMLTFTPGALGHLQDIIFGPDGNLYVVEQGNNIVSEWNPTTGAKISNFISSPGGGASLLTGASFGFDGNFYLAHWDPTGGISKYDGTTGAYIGEFVAVSRPKEVLFVCGACSCTPPTATAAATQPTCVGAGAPDNGTITISGFTNERYQYSSGATFNSGAAIPALITAIPVGGVITSTLPNTTQQYTVRIYDATDDACFVDRVVTITSVVCCSVTINSSTPSACVPATNTYSLTVNVSWVNASGTTLTVSSNALGATPQTITTTLGSSGTQSVTLTGLTSNATMYNVTAQFGAGCTATTTNAFTAPPDCSGCGTPACGSTTYLKKT